VCHALHAIPVGINPTYRAWILLQIVSNDLFKERNVIAFTFSFCRSCHPSKVDSTDLLFTSLSSPLFKRFL
jgi:hypothetical protein